MTGQHDVARSVGISEDLCLTSILLIHAYAGRKLLGINVAYCFVDQL